MNIGINGKPTQSSPLSNHMERISSIINDDLKQELFSGINEQGKLAGDERTSKNQALFGTPINSSENMLRNSIDEKQKIRITNEESD